MNDKKASSTEQETSRELGEVVSRFAHDFNNLLVGIEGNARLLKDEGLILPQGAPLLTQLIDCAMRAADLTESMHKQYCNGKNGGDKLKKLGVRKRSFIPMGETLPHQNVVLIVDDEEIVLSVSKAILTRAGYEVLTAQSGEEGIAIYDEHRDRVACVLLDLTMPYMSGNLVFARLKAIEPTVKVFLISGYSDRQALEQFDTEGIVGFIQKPFNSEKLISAIGAASITPQPRMAVG